MLMVPLGILQLAGANTLAHSIVLVGIGVAAILGAILGIALVTREITLTNLRSNSSGVLISCAAGFAGLLGGLFVAAGYLSTIEHLK